MASNSILNRTELNRYFNDSVGYGSSNECFDENIVSIKYSDSQIISSYSSSNLIPNNGEIFITRTFKYGATADAAYAASYSTFYLNDVTWNTSSTFDIRLNYTRFYRNTTPSTANNGYYMFYDNGQWKYYVVSNGVATRLDTYVVLETLTMSVTSGSLSADVNQSLTIKVMAYYSDGTSLNVTSASGASYSYSQSAFIFDKSTGLVTRSGYGNGTNTFTVTFDGKSSSLNIVTYDYPTNLTLSDYTKTLGVGDTFTLTYSVTMASGTTKTTGATLSSDNTSVATISSSGVVTGIGSGSTYIRVRYTSQGGTIYEEKVCTTTVSVATSFDFWCHYKSSTPTTIKMYLVCNNGPGTYVTISNLEIYYTVSSTIPSSSITGYTEYQETVDQTGIYRIKYFHSASKTFSRRIKASVQADDKDIVMTTHDEDDYTMYLVRATTSLFPMYAHVRFVCNGTTYTKTARVNSPD